MSLVAQGSKRDSSSRHRSANIKSQKEGPPSPSVQRRSKSDQDAHASHQAATPNPGPMQRPPLQKNPSAPLVPRSHQRNDTAWAVLKPAVPRPESERLTRDSITDDPFFSRYRNPQTERLARDFKAQLAGAKTRGEIPDDETTRVTNDENTKDASEPRVDMNLAVLGPKGVGKTTLIRTASELASSESGESGTESFIVDGVNHSLNFVELSSYEVCFSSEHHPNWPPWEHGGPLARVDGVILLFDAMKPDTLALVPQVLGVLHKGRIPNILVSSKCDAHVSKPEIEPEVMEKKARLIGQGQKTSRITEVEPDTFMDVLADLCRDVAQAKLDNPRISHPARRRSRSSVHASSPPPSIKHARASSDVSARSIKNSSSHGNLSTQFNAQGQLVPSQNDGSKKIRSVNNSPRNSGLRSRMNVDTQTANLLQVPTENSPRSFLDLRDSLDIEVRPTLDDAATPKPPPKPYETSELTAMTFEELVERLLTTPHSQEDTKFSAMFLTFYRFFAAPSQLLDQIIKHFRASNSSAIRERDLMVIDQWLSSFPGDFGHLIARQKLTDFLTKVVGNDRIAAAAKALISGVDLIAEDDDTEWAESDSSLTPNVPPPPSIPASQGSQSHDRDRPSTAKTFFSTSSVESSTVSNPSTPTTPNSKSQHRFNQPSADLDSKMIFSSMSSLTLHAMGPSLHSPQALSHSNSTAVDSMASSSSNLQINESAQRKASGLTPSSSQSFTKANFRSFLSLSDDIIARELTRIDWIMFSSIRPRDVIRHVTLPISERSNFRSLENVTRMIDHFNHLAYWTTNIVLFRDKPKHRAQALEKLMRISRKLRELNNYNSLGALVAGIHGTAVHRLAATRALVPVEIQRDFMKLEILMGSEKGSFAYRLAWENSFGARLPFLPLHLRDLVVAEQGSKTFVDGPEAAGTNANAAVAASSPRQVPQASAGAQEVKSDVTSNWYSSSDGSTPTAKQSSTALAASSSSITLTPSNTDVLKSKSPATAQASSSASSDQKKYINTPKLLLLSTTLSSLTSAKTKPYPSFLPSEDVRSLLLDVAVEKDEEKLYERSVALEPAGTGGSAGLNLGLGMGGEGGSRRKGTIPAWLARHGLRVDS